VRVRLQKLWLTMNAIARGFLVPPVIYGNEDAARNASALYLILLSVFAYILLSVVGVAVVFVQKLGVSAILMALTAIAAIAVWLSRRGQVGVASVVLVFGTWLITTTYLVLSGGITGATNFRYVVICVIAALLLGRRGLTICVLLTIVTSLGMVIAEALGHPPPRYFFTRPFPTFITFAVALLVLLVPLNLLLSELKEALDLARKQLKTEERLRQSQKLEAIALLASGIAHDFNNLLTGMLGYTEFVLRSTNKDDPRHGTLEKIKDTAMRGRNLTAQLVAFSRKETIQPRAVDVAIVMKELESMLRSVIPEHIILSFRVARNCGRIKADPGQLSQIIVNLAVNARDAMPHGGRLIVQAENIEIGPLSSERGFDLPTGSYVVLSVRDTGHGMDQNTLSHISEPFFTTKERGKGSGLGLSIVFGIVKQSDGHIQVESAVNRGTTFRIYFPRTQEEIDLADEQASSKEVKGGGETILVVEDDECVRTMLSDVLSQEGYSVILATNPQDAIHLFNASRKKIDLVLSDVVMPGTSGPDFVKRLRKEHPEIKVIFMTGHDNDWLFERSLVDSEAILLLKPFTQVELTNKIREAFNLQGTFEFPRPSLG
jgi:signal transduction histidine kinase/CheY-like chemotaxis protein